MVRWLANPEPDLAGYRIHFRPHEPGPPYDGTAAPPGLPSPLSVAADTLASILGLESGRPYHVALTAFDILGNESGYSVEAVIRPAPTAVTEEAAGPMPGFFRLLPNYPNPFNAGTVIRYWLPGAARAELVIYDLLGRPVRHLASGAAAAGEHVVRWDGADQAGRAVASGVYLCVLQADGSRQVRRMALVR